MNYEQGARVELERVLILPFGESDPEMLPLEVDRARQERRVLDLGSTLRCCGSVFVVARCFPSAGYIAEGTQVVSTGPPVQALRAVQLTALKQPSPGDSSTALFARHVAPFFRALMRDPQRVPLVCVGDCPKMHGVHFKVSAADPGDVAHGVIDSSTTIFTAADTAEEFQRVHIVPFMDTLPNAYQYSVYQDYLRPFFRSHRGERFAQGDTFWHNGVQFKVVAAEPAGPCRVGAATVIHCDGVQRPTARAFLTASQEQQLAALPAPLQAVMLQSDIHNDAETLRRIMAADGRFQQRRGHGLSVVTLEQTTDEQEWTEDQGEQCMVCLCDVEKGEVVRRLPCEHMFHSACIREWLQRNACCPLCRHDPREASTR